MSKEDVEKLEWLTHRTEKMIEQLTLLLIRFEQAVDKIPKGNPNAKGD